MKASALREPQAAGGEELSALKELLNSIEFKFDQQMVSLQLFCEISMFLNGRSL
jgi:hypothetical protein